ncbi:ankyrin repeat protein [Stagonosporopsis vannaccii]|nr:ankyrin repeat protein [Stagonosporopsis vannaccii]
MVLPGQPPSKHGKQLCLLSLDGGGVRGLSTIYIIEELMRKIDPKNPPKPCDYFDIIGGTSTGGLIAIMLGRLQMTTEECKEAYRQLSAKAFKYKGRPVKAAFSNPLKWEVKARFDTAELERGMKDLITAVLKRDPANKDKSDDELENALLYSPEARCKVFVTATAQSAPIDTTVLTSYESSRWPTDFLKTVKIWEAARATSAASSFFDPIEIGDDKEAFLDGGSGANNPVNVVWDEAYDILGSDVEANLQCLVSIGTGIPSLKAFGSTLKAVGETMLSMATETETTARKFERRHTKLDSEDRYFRFNVESGLGDIGLEEADKIPAIASATRLYLVAERNKKRLESCAGNLRLREWFQSRPKILEIATQEHEVTLKRLESFLSGLKRETWIEKMPQFQSWIRGDSPPLCYLDTDESQTGQLVADTMRRHDRQLQVVYVDCALHRATNEGNNRPWTRLLRSIILQSIRVNPEALETVIGDVSLAQNLFPVLKGDLLGETDPPDKDRWFAAVSSVTKPKRGQLPYYIIIDRVHTIVPQITSDVLDALFLLLARIPHVMLVSCENPVVRKGTKIGFALVSAEQESRECINTLSFPEWDARRLVVDKPFRNTDDWVWTHSQFLRWKADAGALWIKGKPGSGKSTIARMITDRIQEEMAFKEAKSTLDKRPMAFAAFFYSSRMGETATKHELMLRSLLYQMLRQYPTLYRHFKPTFRNILSGYTSWQLPELKTVFELMARDCASDAPRLCCVLDGFDESENVVGLNKGIQLQTFLKWLANLSKDCSQRSGLRIIILSRPENGIVGALKSTPTITVEDHNQEAITVLVENGLEKIGVSIREWAEADDGHDAKDKARNNRLEENINTMQESLRTKILEKADGTLQWVVMVIKELQTQFEYQGSYNMNELTAIVTRLPSGSELYKLYAQIVARLENRLDSGRLVKTLRMLSWVCFAQRPLALKELRDALAIHGWEKSVPPATFQQHIREHRCVLLDEDNWAPFVREITDISGCFIEVIKHGRSPRDAESGIKTKHYTAEDTVQFTHQTVIEFVLSKDAGTLQVNEHMCNLDLQVYLKFAASALKEIDYWPYTVKSINPESLAVKASKPLVLAAISYLRDFPLLFYGLAQRNSHPSKTNTAELENEMSIVQHALVQEAVGNSDHPLSELIKTIFLRACERSLLHVAHSLIKACPSTINKTLMRSACETAIDESNLVTLEMFLIKKTSYGYEPFFRAVERDSEDVVRMLLAYRPFLLESWDHRHRTPLLAAAENGSQRTALLLMSHGAKACVFDDDERTPLELAEASGHRSLVALLVDRATDLSGLGLASRALLLAAVANQKPELVHDQMFQTNIYNADHGQGEFPPEPLLHWYNDIARSYGSLGRRRSWPSAPDISVATRERQDPATRCVHMHYNDTSETVNFSSTTTTRLFAQRLLSLKAVLDTLCVAGGQGPIHSARAYLEISGFSKSVEKHSCSHTAQLVSASIAPSKHRSAVLSTTKITVFTMSNHAVTARFSRLNIIGQTMSLTFCPTPSMARKNGTRSVCLPVDGFEKLKSKPAMVSLIRWDSKQSSRGTNLTVLEKRHDKWRLGHFVWLHIQNKRDSSLLGLGCMERAGKSHLLSV